MIVKQTEGEEDKSEKKITGRMNVNGKNGVYVCTKYHLRINFWHQNDLQEKFRSRWESSSEGNDNEDSVKEKGLE